MAFRLIPRDESFYPSFDQLAQTGLEAAKLLHELLLVAPVSEDGVIRIVDRERQADKIEREVLQHLDRAIVTPFDREDIYSLVDRLDDVIDSIRTAGELAQQHHLSVHMEGIDEFTDLLVRITQANVDVVASLRSLGNVSDLVAKVARLEAEADDRYRAIVGELYSGKYDALEVLRWTSVIDRIEKATNVVEKTARLVQTVAIKHT